MAAEQVPSDVFFNIISRLSAPTLEFIFRLKLVCKAWALAIDASCISFMQPDNASLYPDTILLFNHTYDRARTCFHFMKKRSSNNVSSPALSRDERMTIHAPLVADLHTLAIPSNVCNGLLCFYQYLHSPGTGASTGDEGAAVVQICNPVTKEVVAVPHERNAKYVYDYALGVDPTTNTYKIIGFFYKWPNGVSTYRAEVHTLGTRSWIPVKNVPGKFLSRHPIFANGALHWDPRTNRPGEAEPRPPPSETIISFDVKNEFFYKTKCPRFARSHLTVLKGRLARVEFSCDGYTGIMLLDEKSSQWVKFGTIGVSLRESGGFDATIIGTWDCDDEILFELRGELYSYNMKTQRRMHQRRGPSLCCDRLVKNVVGFRGSMLSPSRLNQNLVD